MGLRLLLERPPAPLLPMPDHLLIPVLGIGPPVLRGESIEVHVEFLPRYPMDGGLEIHLGGVLAHAAIL